MVPDLITFNLIWMLDIKHYLESLVLSENCVANWTQHSWAIFRLFDSLEKSFFLSSSGKFRHQMKVLFRKRNKKIDKLFFLSCYTLCFVSFSPTSFSFTSQSQPCQREERWRRMENFNFPLDLIVFFLTCFSFLRENLIKNYIETLLSSFVVHCFSRKTTSWKKNSVPNEVCLVIKAKVRRIRGDEGEKGKTISSSKDLK